MTDPEQNRLPMSIMSVMPALSLGKAFWGNNMNNINNIEAWKNYKKN